MLLHDCEQGSPEWFKARAGVTTASMFSTIRAKVGGLDDKQRMYVQHILEGGSSKEAMEVAGYRATPSAAAVSKALELKTLNVGDWSEATKNYAFRLACERIAGCPLADQFETYAMRRGKELEEACRRRHEQDIQLIVDLAGFVTTEDGKFGCSADSLIDPDGGAEYKAFYAPDMVRPIIMDSDWGDVMDQVQGCMWITGRKWWDMCLYLPALHSVEKDFTRRRVLRDDNYIEQLEDDLVAFDRMVTEWELQLRTERNAA